MGSSQAALRTVVALLSLWLCLLASTTHAQSFNSTTTSNSNTTTQYLRMTWTETDVVRITFAEPFLTNGIKAFLQNASSVRVIDIREPAFPMELAAATRSTFQVLFMVKSSNQTTTNSTKLNSTTTTISANNTQQGDFQSNALVKYLQQNLTTPTSDTLSTSDAGYNASTSASWTASFFPISSIKFAFLSTEEAQALGPFAALTQLSTPVSNNSSFMTFDVVFRNIHSASNLMRGLIYQARQGVTRFLQLPAIADVYAAGPAQVPANAALQVVQRYYLVLSRNGSQSNSNLTTTMVNRERLANLLLYGDPTREVADFEANDGYFATMRASMFFDYILPANTSSSSSLSGASDTTLEVSMMEALFSYALSSITVDQFPTGNPSAPSPVTNATTSVIPGVSNDVFASKMRKRQRFLYDASFASATSSGSSSGLQYPTVIQSNASSSCTMVNGFCTYIYWKNSLTSTFWLESMESVYQVAWNLFPTVPFFAIANPSTTSLLAPIVIPGNTSTPIWTFGALSGPSNRLDFALNLRNADDNATALKVEISTDVRSAVEATSTITSIARDTRSSFGNVSASQPPIYETKSNIVVTYQSRFRNANEVFLFLEIKNSSATAKDTSQPCAHCQNLYEWCASQPKCAALSSCVFLQGIDRDQIPYQMLFTSPLQDVRELWPYFQNCMGALTDSVVDLKAMLLLSNAVRCQMQRLCPFRTASYYGDTGDSSKILIWESVEGRHQLKTTPPTNSHFSQDVPVNVSMRLGSQVLCYLPILSNTTVDSLEERISRNCKLSKYLGRVSVSVNMTGGNNASANSYDSIDIRYKYIVGPLPTLEIVPPSVNTSSFNETTVSVEIMTLAFPGIRLRLETKDFQSILPPAPTTATPEPCTKCNTLALDVCLRDLKCVAFTDCIMRWYPIYNGVSMPPPVGDVILDAFRTQAIGKQISLSSAIDACHSSANVNQVEWRKLVNASACFSKNACPISMQMLVPSSEKLVGKWHISPAQKLQKLLYQQQAGEAVAASDLQIPLVLVRNSEVVKTDSCTVADPRELERKLQKLLEYDDLSVEIEFDKLQSDSGLRTIQWNITYSHWTGSLPRFLPDTSSPKWTLFTYPTPQQDFYLEVLNKTALATDNSTLSNITAVAV